ncbi:uncharacterized protein CCR75_008723 [Bremia lactucae]|uniref:Uncharacterized protein n=1 Tax=Bremia lactucae TaxID=4779 RepID=A0A976FNB8_BRELC|nr:hypothetical protein CCR75_008723 [Bremia lactucae]
MPSPVLLPVLRQDLLIREGGYASLSNHRRLFDPRSPQPLDSRKYHPTLQKPRRSTSASLRSSSMTFVVGVMKSIIRSSSSILGSAPSVESTFLDSVQASSPASKRLVAE